MKHWAKSYIGKPWARMARGPDSFDCWGLVYDVYKTHYNIELPQNLIDPIHVKAYAMAINEGKDHPDWIEKDEPKEGYVVPLSKSRLFHHVGIWLDVDEGVILHAHQGSCVVAQSMHSMKAHNWTKFKYYTHRKLQG